MILKNGQTKRKTSIDYLEYGVFYEYNKNTGIWRFEDEQGSMVLSGSKEEVEKSIKKNKLTKLN